MLTRIHVTTEGAPERGLGALAALLLRIEAAARTLRVEPEREHPDRSTDRQDQRHARCNLPAQLQRPA